MPRLGLVVIPILIAACGPSATSRPATSAPVEPATVAAQGFRATLHWTSHGVPHVVATDVGGLGLGQGYAQARAHLCEIADSVVRVRGERARYLGRGDGDAHVASDLANLHLGYRARAEQLLPSMSAETRAMLAGYAAGYDLALAQLAPAQRPAACRDAAWLVPITAADVAAYALSLQSLASSHFLESAIAAAQPGGGAGASIAPPDQRRGASNAWAIGGERTASGGAILVGNPHFPWEGDLLFHEAQLTIPGDLDVYGGSLIGVPGIQIGTTAHHAWTHTFSASTHMILYRVALSDHSALRYRHGDDTLAITPAIYSIAVRGADGTLVSERHTLYRSAVGPMLVTPSSPWDGPGGHAFTVRDVAIGGTLALDQYLAIARAQSRGDFEDALALHGTPFVTTTYADATGEVLFVDGARVPALGDDALGAWRFLRKVAPPLEEAWRQGLVIVDGSDPINDLPDDDPRGPGAFPIAAAPRVLRRDFVMNANDSYRFTNLAAPETLAPRSPLYGDDATRPSVRTLENLALLEPGSGAAGADDRFTLDEAAAAMLSNRSLVADRLRDDVLAVCPKPGRKTTPRSNACAVLARWDGRFAVDSRGPVLWRKVMARLAPAGTIPWAHAFDRQAPHLTPDGLTVTPDAIRAALSGAAAELEQQHLALDVPLGDVQRAVGPAGELPIPGGTDSDGVANVVTWNSFNATLLPRAPAAGTAPVNFGSSYLLAVELTPAGRTVRALLTYGNSSDPASPWYRDQLGAFARAELRTVPLTDAEIAADPDHRVEEIHSP